MSPPPARASGSRSSGKARRLERDADRIQRPALDGVDLPDGPPDRDWGWPGYEFAIPADWPSGVYVAMLIEIAADGSEIAPDCNTTFATSAKALFVVRHRGPVPPGTVLYKVSWATFVAYNGTGYGSLYTEAVWSREQPEPRLQGDLATARLRHRRRRDARRFRGLLRYVVAAADLRALGRAAGALAGAARLRTRTTAPIGTCIAIPGCCARTACC